ncbi:MAG: ACT domain-containing protein [Candidatus Thermoplasmatota archaeon]|nr:ACT domain-containing protein [Candidatus Thermoplasmatota archaeon]
MWEPLSKHFRKYHAQAKIAELLMRYGLRVKPDGVYCGEIKIPDSALAEVVGGDARVVSATINTILREPRLTKVFSKLVPSANLRDVAPEIGWGVLEATVSEEADRPGILASVAKIIADANVNIKQVIVESVEAPPVRIIIITETLLPGEFIHKIREILGVKSVTIY